MNYGKKEIDSKIDKINSSNKKVFNKIKLNVKIFAVIIVFTLILCAVFSGVGIVRGLTDSAPDINEENIMPDGYPSIIYEEYLALIIHKTSYKNKKYIFFF